MPESDCIHFRGRGAVPRAPHRRPQDRGLTSPAVCRGGILALGPGQGQRRLTLQGDGLTPAHAIVTLVEVACLIGSRYLLGGSNHQPGGKGETGHHADNWGGDQRWKFCHSEEKWGGHPRRDSPPPPSRKKTQQRKNEEFIF